MSSKGRFEFVSFEITIECFCSLPAQLAVLWARKIAEVMVTDSLTKFRERNVKNMS